MNITQKVISTIAIIVVVGLISTVLYEKNGNAPGDGIIGFILFGGMLAVVILIWRSNPDKMNTSKEHRHTSKETTLDIQDKDRSIELDLEMKVEITRLYQKYEEDYTQLEKEFTTTNKKNGINFIAFEKALGEKYSKIVTDMEEKYPNVKGKLSTEFFKRIVKFHYKKQISSPKEAKLTKEQIEVSKKIIKASSLFEESGDSATKLRGFFNEVMPAINAYKTSSNNISAIKGQYTTLLYSDDQNSIATTVKSIISPLRDYGFTGTRNKTEAMTAFSILLGQRAQAAMMGGITKGNYLLDTGMNVYNGMYEECFVVDADKYKIDLPLFVFTAMYLESPIKRNSLKQADNILKSEFFDCIYNICKEEYPVQVQFSREEALEGMDRFSLFLQRKYL